VLTVETAWLSSPWTANKTLRADPELVRIPEDFHFAINMTTCAMGHPVKRYIVALAGKDDYAQQRLQHAWSSMVADVTASCHAAGLFFCTRGTSASRQARQLRLMYRKPTHELADRANHGGASTNDANAFWTSSPASCTNASASCRLENEVNASPLTTSKPSTAQAGL
jgi:fructose-1,6-bisphosphatase